MARSKTLYPILLALSAPLNVKVRSLIHFAVDMTVAYPISLYNPPPIACYAYDPQAPEVARWLKDLIRGVLPEVEVEHVGSTSVPECPGKGYIDLMVLYSEGALGATRVGLGTLGFQRQSSRDPFPEERPMRVGTFAYGGKQYPVHAHVIAINSPEAEELRWFRERLKADEKLRDEYVAEKRRILAAGVSDSVEYALSKGAFVQRVLAMFDTSIGRC